jgi:integrase
MLCSDKQADERVFGLNYRSLGTKIKERADKAGVPIHTHSFRHYFATTLVERGEQTSEWCRSYLGTLAYKPLRCIYL